MKNSKTIVLLSGNQLCNNPRVIKEADALFRAGYKTVVVGANFTNYGKTRDQHIMIGRRWKYELAFDFTRRSVDVFLIKFQRRIGQILYRYLGFPNRWQLGYGAVELMKKVISLKPDLVIAHWGVAISVCESLMSKGLRVGVDMEDWFSEELLPEKRKSWPIKLLKNLEKRVLCEGVWSSCPSEAMADALVKAYGCQRPVVIRNVFPAKDREKFDGLWKDRPEMMKLVARNDPEAVRPEGAPVSIHWFSQTIGPGRGLEKLFAALDGISGEWELHLRGNLNGYAKWLNMTSSSKIRRKLKIHPQVSNEELPSRIAEHDIGFCGESKIPLNKNLTIANKFFQYLQSGLAVVCSDTCGQREGAAEAFGAIEVFSANSLPALQKVLKRLLINRTLLLERRAQAWKAGKKLCWELESRRFDVLKDRAF